MKLAITSMAEGREWKKISSVSFPTFEQYARRIGADFVPLHGRKFPEEHFHWEKLSMSRLLKDYDRVMWTDCDAIILSTAPSIFEIVPEKHFGAFDEGLIFDREYEFKTGADFYNIRLKEPSERSF